MPSMQCRFAAIADDFTGGSDLAGMLRAQGIATVQLFGVPASMSELQGQYQAAVLSLKSRSIHPVDACRLALAAADALAALDPAQWCFKYCSTFDSTPRGNIGPVTGALMTHLGTDFTVAVPALPVNGRTQYLGHLFVNGVPLAESPMKDHPLNPMTDSNLVRWLARQTSRQVDLIPLPEVQSETMRRRGEIALVDAVTDTDLNRIAAFADRMPLVTGGSGIGAALARRWPGQATTKPRLQRNGGTLLLSGSCSAMTLTQLERIGATGLCQRIALDLTQLTNVADQAASLLRQGKRPLIASAAAPGERQPGAEGQIEHAFAGIARQLAAHAANVIVAGGETSGAVVEALGVEAAEVESILAPGVPALRTLGEPAWRLALKSGNFGGPDFFAEAIHYLES